jgi:hypothetical protein
MKRYACVPFIIDENLVVHDSKQLMANCTKGPWVKWSDVAPIIAERDALAIFAESRRVQINELMDGLEKYTTPQVEGVTFK